MKEYKNSVTWASAGVHIFISSIHATRYHQEFPEPMTSMQSIFHQPPSPHSSSIIPCHLHVLHLLPPLPHTSASALDRISSPSRPLSSTTKPWISLTGTNTHNITIPSRIMPSSHTIIIASIVAINQGRDDRHSRRRSRWSSRGNG